MNLLTRSGNTWIVSMMLINHLNVSIRSHPMNHHQSRSLTKVLGLALAFAPPVAFSAITGTIKGVLSGFDINNDTGQYAAGFEIQIEGADINDLYLPGYGEAYGRPTFVPYETGVYVRWESAYDSVSGTYAHRTPPRDPANPTFAWTDCYQAGPGYKTSGCEHFSQALRSSVVGKNVTISARWLVEDPQHPGTLVGYEKVVDVPFPTYTVSPVPASPPVVIAKIDPPEPPEAPELYGDAQWVKVYRAEVPFPLTDDQLTVTNPIIPLDPTQVDIAWDIIQAEPQSGCNGGCGGRSVVNAKPVQKPETRAVIERVEIYRYSGAYDAITHAVACADGSCTAPAASELGQPISAQNSAVNIDIDAVHVTVSGSGDVSDSLGDISCGSSCSAFEDAGAIVTLIADQSKGAFYPGWSGACAGSDLICDVVVNGPTEVGAAFSEVLSVSASRGGGTGKVESTNVSGGILTTAPISCGDGTANVCSTKISQGATITFVATAASGYHFVSWSNSCSGTAPTCTVTANAKIDARASFAADSTGGGGGNGGGGGGKGK